MKHILKLWVILFCLTSLLVACNPGGGGFFPTPEPTKLVFAVPNDHRDYYTAKVAEFKKQNAEVEIELVNSDTTASTQLDIAVLRWDQIFSQGSDTLAKALDITPFLEQTKGLNRGDYYKGVLEPFTRDGKLKGLPTGVDPYVIFYNRDLFDSAGVTYPKLGWAWNDFRTTAMQLRDPIARTYGYATTMDYVDSLFFIYQHGGNLLNGQTPQLDSPEAIEALDWYAKLYTTSNVAPTQEQARKDFNGDFNLGIMSGKVGMWMSPVSGITGPNGKGWPFNVGIAPLPRDQIGFSVAQFEGLTISQNTKSPQTAWRFVSFLADQPLPWMVPARQSLVSSPAYATAIGKDQANAAQAAMQDASLISTFDFRSLSNVIEVFSGATRAVVEGKSTAAEALKAAQKRMVP